MRLTLRTLLAYLDDILEPQDAAEISRKIEESKFATDLIHRIRNSTRRLRLGAPPLDARGIGLDANTVSEYLDNIKSLRPEQIADFEKICLESDVHLAEVASCHQVLTLVLGQPADVDETTRARMYQLGTGEALAAHAALPAELPAESAAAAAPLLLDEEDRLEVPQAAALLPVSASAKPDYRQAGKGLPIQSLAITLVCGFLLAVVALRAMGPFGPTHPVWRMFSGGEEAVVAEQAAGGGQTQESPPPPEAPAHSGGDIRETPDAEKSDELPPVLAAGEGAGAPAAPASAEADVPVAPVPPVDAASTPAAPPAEEPLPASPPAPGSEMAVEEPPAPTTDDAADVPPAAPERQSVGRYISEEQVLAQMDSESGSWFRLATDEPLGRGNRLLSLPSYRPQILLAPNLKITFSGEASATAYEPFNAETATLQIDSGRAVVVSADSNPAQVRMELAEREGVARLSDPDSNLAVEVVPFVPDGLDPIVTPRRMAVRLLAVSGQISWVEGLSEQTIAAGEALLLEADSPPRRVPAGPLPAWVEGTDASDIELRAARELRRHLALDRPLNLSLLERTEFRQEEVRALAARCLASLDVFEPAIKALDDQAQRSYWPSHFESLQKAVHRHAESAARVLADLQKNYGDEGRALFRLLWGYTPEQLESGEDRELVRHLEHPTMIGRVLAIENLRRITDKTMLFNAWLPPSQEKSKILKWQRAAEEGTIRYAKPVSAPAAAKPAPLPTGGSSTKPPRSAS